MINTGIREHQLRSIVPVAPRFKENVTMLNQFVHRFSFGGMYVPAAMFYVGLGLIVLGFSPQPTVAYATGDCTAENPSCPPGYFCCSGTCVPDNYVCCDDGTSGPSDMCVCCTGCTENCNDPSTLVCE